MSDRSARSLRLPDKIINWIDTACVRVEIGGNEEKTVRSPDILGVISEETKTPADIVRRDVLERFRDLGATIATWSAWTCPNTGTGHSPWTSSSGCRAASSAPNEGGS